MVGLLWLNEDDPLFLSMSEILLTIIVETGECREYECDPLPLELCLGRTKDEGSGYSPNVAGGMDDDTGSLSEGGLGLSIESKLGVFFKSIIQSVLLLMQSLEWLHPTWDGT